MSKLSPDMSSVTRIGLDLAKTIFQVHAIDAAGSELDKRAIRRGKQESGYINYAVSP